MLISASSPLSGDSRAEASLSPDHPCLPSPKIILKCVHRWTDSKECYSIIIFHMKLWKKDYQLWWWWLWWRSRKEHQKQQIFTNNINFFFIASWVEGRREGFRREDAVPHIIIICSEDEKQKETTRRDLLLSTNWMFLSFYFNLFWETQSE